MNEKDLGKEKPMTVMYFSDEIKSQLKYYKILERKLHDLNVENRSTVEDIVKEYSDIKKEIDRHGFIKIKKLSMLFSSVLSDIQTTITRLDYIKTVAASGFGIFSFNLTEEEQREFNDITVGMNPLMFCLKTDKDGIERLEVKDSAMFEIVESRASSSVPKDQKSLRDLYNQLLVSYNQEKSMEEKQKSDIERRQRQQAEAEAHEKEISKYGKKADTAETPDSEG